MKDKGEYMRSIRNEELKNICGGFHPVATAVGVGVGVYVGASQVITATKTLNNFGADLGKHIYESTHPNELGQMTYTAADFKQS